MNSTELNGENHEFSSGQHRQCWVPWCQGWGQIHREGQGLILRAYTKILGLEPQVRQLQLKAACVGKCLCNSWGPKTHDLNSATEKGAGQGGGSLHQTLDHVGTVGDSGKGTLPNWSLMRRGQSTWGEVSNPSHYDKCLFTEEKPYIGHWAGTKDTGWVILVLKKLTIKYRSYNEMPPLLTGCSHMEQRSMRKPATDWTRELCLISDVCYGFATNGVWHTCTVSHT